VWRVVRDFNGLPTWHPGIDSSEMESGSAGEPGAIRKLTLGGGGGIVREVLLRLDDLDHSYIYQILESPFPVRSYISTIRIAPVTATGESFVEWWADYDAEGADEAELNATFSQNVYATGIAGLASHVKAG
jgi:hypothetical protein